MPHSINRRTVIKASLAGVGVTALAPGVALAAGGDDFPPIPGMQGDRRANEMWYVLDERSYFNPSKEVQEAYGAIHAHTGGENPFFGIRDRWREMVALPDYPRNYTEFVTPIRPQMSLLSSLQLDTFDGFYAPNSPGFVDAHAFFAQGVLYDPRRPPAVRVHTMDALPFYHTWHAFLRAMMFLDISSERWARIAPVVGFTWAVQSVAKPVLDRVNPPLPDYTVDWLKRSWLPRTTERLDRDFQSSPEPADLGPWDARPESPPVAR